MKIASPVVRKRARIEIIPLIDIVFFLLATFAMVSLSMVKNQGVSVHLPVAASGTSQATEHVITISIKGNGQIYFDKDLVSEKDLKDRLDAAKKQISDLKILINGDEDSRFGRAVEVLDEVRKLGITKVAIRTRAPGN